MSFRLLLNTFYLLLPVSCLVACQPAGDTDTATGLQNAQTDQEKVGASLAEPEAVGDEDHAQHDEDEVEDEDHDHHHDHDDEMAGGDIHQHGHAELALTLEGRQLSVSLISPLANFGLSEAKPDLSVTTLDEENIVQLQGGACQARSRELEVETDGQHGHLEIRVIFDCAEVGTLTEAEVTLFETYPGFDEIDAILLTEDAQIGAGLTKSARSLLFP